MTIARTRTVLTGGGVVVALVLSACGGSSGGGSSGSSTRTTRPDTPAPVATASAGSWTGSINTPLPESRGLKAVILPDGSFWMTYTAAGDGHIAGILQGKGILDGNSFSASDATLLSLEDGSSGLANLSASAVAQSSLSGAIVLAADAPPGSLPSPASFSALYQPSSRETLTLADLTGTYSGTITTQGGAETATVFIDASGAISGSNSAGCSITGTTQAQPSGTVFTTTLRFGSEAACGANHGIEASGVLSLTAGQATLLALDSGKTNSFIFNGSK